MKVSQVGPAIIGVALLSCATPTENELPAVELLTDRTPYVVGDSAVLTLTNRSTNSIVVDWTCGEVIQQMVGTSWESLGGFPDEFCIMEDEWRVDPDASIERQFQVAARAFPSTGEYRVQVPAADPGSRRSFVIWSNPFTVEN
jgi:hypothetical protein